jgi:hypothetical protein
MQADEITYVVHRYDDKQLYPPTILVLPKKEALLLKVVWIARHSSVSRLHGLGFSSPW